MFIIRADDDHDEDNDDNDHDDHDDDDDEGDDSDDGDDDDYSDDDKDSDDDNIRPSWATVANSIDLRPFLAESSAHIVGPIKFT